jgi:hypothetical protein
MAAQAWLFVGWAVALGGWLVGELVAWFVGWLFGVLVGCLVGVLGNGWLVVDWLVG